MDSQLLINSENDFSINEISLYTQTIIESSIFSEDYLVRVKTLEKHHQFFGEILNSMKILWSIIKNSKGMMLKTVYIIWVLNAPLDATKKNGFKTAINIKDVIDLQ